MDQRRNCKSFNYKKIASQAPTHYKINMNDDLDCFFFFCAANLKNELLLKSFCGFMTLRTGCTVLGMLEMLNYIVMMGSKPSLVYTIGFVCSTTLVLGIFKNNRHYLWPSIIWNTMQTITLAMVLCLGTLITTALVAFDQMSIKMDGGGGGSSSRKISELNVAMSFAIPVLIVLITIGAFFSLALYSLNVEMREQEKRAAHPHPSAPFGLVV